MKHSSRVAAAAVALLALLVCSAPARAAVRQSAPSVVGSYFVSGTDTIYSCTFPGSESTVPIQAYFTVTSQDGSSILGNLGYPAQQVVLADFVATISPDGLFEGTFTIVDMSGGGVTYSDATLTGRFANGKVSADFDVLLTSGDVACRVRIALASQSATLSWSAPDTSTADLAPPRALTIVENPEGPPQGISPVALLPAPRVSAPAAPAARREGDPTGYNVYRSGTPNVQPSPENLLTSVPPTQTTVPTPVDAAGSFFVVTATYDAGESGPSNEVSGGVPAGTIASVKLTTKLVAKGTDFSPTVQVFLDGIPFVAPARVKVGKKVAQKGNLLTGQSLAQYVTSGKTVTISVRNENGGIATYVYTKP
jgi:hypothetical protein